jgi:hypothetical protein
VINQVEKIGETRYSYVGSSENNLLKVRERLCRGGKNTGKEKRAPNPLRDLDGNQDRSNNYLSRSFLKRTPSLE